MKTETEKMATATMAKPAIILLSLLLTLAAQGQQLQRIAILGTEDDGEPPVQHLELSHLTDKLREIAGKTLPKTRYGIMTQQSIVDRLGSEERAAKMCREATCLADLGRKISADYIAQARIGRFGGNLTIKIELYNVGNSNLIASFTDNSKNVQGLLSVMEAKAPALFMNMPGISSGTSTASPSSSSAAAAPVQVSTFPVPKPKMAVYLIGGKLKPNEIEMIETKISIPFVQSGQFTMIERGDPFLGTLAMEMRMKKDVVEDMQIRGISKQAGVRFVCVVKIVEAFGLISVSARLIDAESAEVPKVAEAEIKNLSEIGKAANEIFKQISASSNMLADLRDRLGNKLNASFFTDSRDKQKYRTMKIGDQTWMAENLNYNMSSSKCYDNLTSNCKKYGRLYNWNMAMKACPSGWRLPSKTEWENLIIFAGTEKVAGKHLKAKSGWNDSKGLSDNSDTYGFAALPGGDSYSNGHFGNAGSFGRWWGSSDYDSIYAYIRAMDYLSEGASWGYIDKSYLFSVRCVQD
jgi:uncharacterized protein (TIGR02145 family)